MSLINDALKRASQNPPPLATPPQIPTPIELKMMPPIQPVADARKSGLSRLFPATVIFFIVAAVVAGGWAASHHPVRTVAAASTQAVSVETTVETVAAPAAVLPTVHATTTTAVPDAVTAPITVQPKTVPLVNPPDAPKLQGICYVPGKSSAILDGKSVRPGDKFLQYRVKEISQIAVTLVDADGKAIKLDMGN